MRDVGWKRGRALLALVLAAILFARPAPGPAAAQGKESLTPYLPPSARVAQVFSDRDTDADGVPDLVALYLQQTSATAPASVNAVVVHGPADARTAEHLLGDPAGGPGGPTLPRQGAADLAVRDLNGDGQAEIAIAVRAEGPAPRSLLWVFRWDGSSYRAEAHLEGTAIQIVEPAPGQEAGLRVMAQQRRWSESAAVLVQEDEYRWRDGGYRLARRSLALSPDSAPIVNAEMAVLAFYQAIGRGDLPAAYAMLGPDLRAAYPYESWAAGFATTRAVLIEEARAYRPDWDLRNDPPRDSPVYARITAFDDAQPAPVTRSFAGVWRVAGQGESWRLEAAHIEPAPSLAEIADALPPGRVLLQTAQGDLRGSGQTDLAVVVQPPSRYALAEPLALLRDGAGYRLMQFEDVVADFGLRGPGGDLSVEDVTGDGRPELVYGGSVGAHSSVLWVLTWDGQAFAPLFDGFSNSPALGLQDLDRDGLPEILIGQSGYCGSYAGSPQILFAFRWRDGAYRPASLDFPAIVEDFPRYAEAALAELERRPGEQGSAAPAACIHHMAATAHVLAGRPAEARAAYRRYQESRGQVADRRQALEIFPAYLSADFFQEQIRDVIERAEAGHLGTWGTSDLALLQDLLGNSFESRWQFAAARASSAESTDPDDAEAARRAAAAAQEAATRAYRAALALDPADEEATAGLGRIGGP